MELGANLAPLEAVGSCDGAHYGAWDAPQPLLGSLAGPSNGYLLPFLLLPTQASNNFISWPVLEQHLASMFLL